MRKKILYVLLFVFIAIQFIRPEKNKHEIDANKQVITLFLCSDEVRNILQRSCNDCHSNNTTYPWYNNIQPVMWYLNNHVKDGKKHLNFDEYASYELRRQYHKMEEIVEQVESDEMPLSSYTLIHSDAKLNKEQKTILIEWAKANMNLMKATHPIDSLTKKKK